MYVCVCCVYVCFVLMIHIQETNMCLRTKKLLYKAVVQEKYIV